MENKIENINSNFNDIEEIVNNLEARGKALDSIKNLYDAFLFEYSITNLSKKSAKNSILLPWKKILII